MCTKTVVFGNSSPPNVYHFWSFLFGTNTILPVIGVCKASSRPAQVWNIQFFEGGNNIVANAFGVRDISVFFTNIKAIINATSQVLREMAIYVPADLSFLSVGADRNIYLGKTFV